MNDVDRAFAALWKKGAEGEVRVPCSKPGQAEYMRFQAYAFSKKVKKAPAVWGQELLTAIEGASLCVEGQTLVARPKLSASGMKSLVAALGGADAMRELAGETAMEKAAQDSSRRMQEMMDSELAAGPGPAPVPAPATAPAPVPAPVPTPAPVVQQVTIPGRTPYYTRTPTKGD